MPNWCSNFVEISHESAEQIDRVQKAFAEHRLCDEFLPVPEDLKNAVADGSANESLVEKYGYSSWYDFCVNLWGTKWDVGSEDGIGRDGDTYLTLSFDSAWSPPIGLYEELESLGYTVRAYYYEPGMNYAGVFSDGYDDCYNLESTSEAVREQIPSELDEMFCISENMEQWEAENE